MRIFCIICLAGLTSAASGEVTSDRIVTADPLEVSAVEIENTDGDIIVEETSGDNIEVSWIITCETSSEMEAMEVLFEEGETFHFEVRYDRDWEGAHSGRVDFTVLIPREAGLSFDLSTVNGLVSMEETEGEALIGIVNGRVEVNGFSGALAVEAVNGEISISEASGLESLDMVNGRAKLSLDGLDNPLSISTVNASITAELDVDASVVISTMSGELKIADELSPVIETGYTGSSARFGSGEPVISISTLNGDIDITR